MTELTTSTKDSGLTITIFRPVVPRKGSLLGFFLSVLHYMSLVLSSEISSSLLSSSFVLVSLPLAKTTSKGHNCLHELAVGTSLSLSKISFSLLSETSELVSAHNSLKTLSPFRHFYAKP